MIIVFNDNSRGKVRLNVDKISYLRECAFSKLPDIIPDDYDGHNDYCAEDFDFDQTVALLLKAGLKGIQVNIDPATIKILYPEEARKLASEGHDATRHFIIIEKIESYQQTDLEKPPLGTDIFFKGGLSIKVTQSPEQIDTLIKKALGKDAVLDTLTEYKKSKPTATIRPSLGAGPQ